MKYLPQFKWFFIFFLPHPSFFFARLLQDANLNDISMTQLTW